MPQRAYGPTDRHDERGPGREASPNPKRKPKPKPKPKPNPNPNLTQVVKLAGAGDAITSSTGVSVALAASAGEAERAGSAEEGEDNQLPHAEARRLGTRVPVAGLTRPDMGALLRRAPP